MNEVKHRMMAPRQQFQYSCGNLVVASPGLNCNLGPKPLSCEVETMLSHGVFLVAFGIEVCLAACATNPIRSPVVSVKWSQSESFDKDWLSTVTTRGRLVVRSDLRQSADSFRNLCVPGMISDYRRESIEFTLSESGCELGFVVTDKAVAVPVPYGATDMPQGQFTVVLARAAASGRDRWTSP
jgi:hypothetical protein